MNNSIVIIRPYRWKRTRVSVFYSSGCDDATYS